MGDFGFKVRMRAFTLDIRAKLLARKKLAPAWDRTGDHRKDSDDENH